MEQLPKESSNDRNDRAIRMAMTWYETHLKGKKVKILLLSDDAKNREKANIEGITAMQVREYVKSLTDAQFLQDKLSLKEFSKENTNKPCFPPHLTLVEIHEGIKNGKLYQGSFSASRENYLEGNINVECFEKFVLVQGPESLNRAVDGDIVALELLPEKEWKAPSEVVLEDKGADPEDDSIEVDKEAEKLMKTSRSSKDIQRTGRIVGIIKRKWRQYCGIIKPNILEGSARHSFIPAERKIPHVRIETRQAKSLYNQRVVVAIDSWPRHSKYPMGHFIRSLGPVGDKDTENEVLLLEHDVPHCKFSEEVLDCLPKLPWIISKKVSFLFIPYHLRNRHPLPPRRANLHHRRLKKSFRAQDLFGVQTEGAPGEERYRVASSQGQYEVSRTLGICFSGLEGFPGAQ